jgi:cation:H+ antiporter
VDWFELILALVVILGAADLFTNGIEWIGERFGLSEGAVGSVLAAVGTALPETLLPLVAILLGRSGGEDIGIGAILGAPFMLSTLAMFVLAVAVPDDRAAR